MPSAVSWVTYVTPVLVLLSAIIAIIGVRNARSVARQKATLDLIEKVESSEHYRARNAVFSRRRTGPGFADLNAPMTDSDREDRSAVVDYLNHYEIVAIGIRSNILDAEFYRRWMVGPFVRDWNAASDWVQRERWKWDAEARLWRYRHQLFENFQWLAIRWSAEARVLTSESSAPPPHSAGPGDAALPVSNAEREPA